MFTKFSSHLCNVDVKGKLWKQKDAVAFFRYYNQVTEGMAVFLVYFLYVFFSFFYYLVFRIEGFHFLPPKYHAVVYKDQNEYGAWKSAYLSTFFFLVTSWLLPFNSKYLRDFRS